jgi:hypothetical protein
MRDNEPDYLDALIDDTARAMMAGTPPALLRAAVRQRIERPARTLWTWQTALAAASIMLVAFVAARAWLTVTGEPELARPVVATVEPVAEAPLPRPPEPTPAITRRVAREALLVDPTPIEIEPLVLQPVDPMVLAVETIAAPMPLNIRPIVVEPLSLQ